MTHKIFRFLVPEDASTIKKSIFFFLMILVFINSATFLEDAYWKYWPFDPATIHSITVTNPGKAVCAGSPMKYEVEITKNMDVPCSVKRTLVNSSLILYPAEYPPRKKLGYQKVPASIHVPRAADYREYFMKFTIDYEIGPNKRIVSRSKDSELFTVINCAEPREGKQGEPGKQGPAGKDGRNFWGR
jgi:hypothetical protein